MSRILIPNLTFLLRTQIIAWPKCHAFCKVLAAKYCDTWKIRNRIPDKERALIVAVWKSLCHWPNSQNYKPTAPNSDEYSSSSHYKLNTSAWWHTHVPDIKSFVLTVGGERLTVDPRRSWGPMLECRLMGSPPPPGVPPGEEAHDGAMRIFGGIMRALSERRRFGNALWTLRKLLSGDDGEAPNHQPPKTPESVALGSLLLTCTTVTTARLEQVHGSWSLHRTHRIIRDIPWQLPCSGTL